MIRTAQRGANGIPLLHYSLCAPLFIKDCSGRRGVAIAQGDFPPNLESQIPGRIIRAYWHTREPRITLESNSCEGN